MYLTVLGETRRSAGERGNLDAVHRKGGREIARRSLLLWGEHCTECAMPDCYASCAFYTPRQDFKCRRFARGIELIADGPGAIALGVSFRQWGKLEAEGRLTLLAPGRAGFVERLFGWAESALPATLPSLRGRDFLVRALNRLKRHAMLALGESAAPNAFVVECISDTVQAVDFTLTIRAKSGGQAFFQAPFTIAPGYNYLTIDTGDIGATLGSAHELLVQVEPLQMPPANHFVFSFLDFAHFSDRASILATGRRRERAAEPAFCKCVVWDLDNTMWQGTLIEDGLENLKLDPRAVAAVKELDRRGILQSIASKNNERDVMEALDRFGLREFFLYPQIYWGPKSGSVKAIAEQLNIGVDSLAIIDDQPFELAEVKAALPSVTTIAALELPDLLDRAIFAVPATEESRRRRLMYREEEQRALASKTAGADFIAFLRTCQIELVLTALGDANRERVFELTQRTNQLNYAGRRCSREAIEALEKDGPRRAYVLSCRDRFGDYGIIGFAVVDTRLFEVEDFFMSCRVQNKLVDHAFFGFLACCARRAEVTTLTVQFRATGRNEPARAALAEIGFRAEAEANGMTRYLIAAVERLSNDDIVAVDDRSGSVQAAPMAVAGTLG